LCPRRSEESEGKLEEEQDGSSRPNQNSPLAGNQNDPDCLSATTIMEGGDESLWLDKYLSHGLLFAVIWKTEKIDWENLLFNTATQSVCYR
jgi:hypothetical protein